MPNVFMTLIVFLAGCSGKTDGDLTNPEDGPSPSMATTQESGGSESTSEIVFFPEEFARDLDHLQDAIDLQLEDLTTSCMAKQGFAYTSRSLDEIRFGSSEGAETGIGTTNSAQFALDNVFELGPNAKVGPSNQRNITSLTDEELVVWERTRQDCQVSESAAQGSPWDEINTDWWLGLQQDAASRTQADGRYLDAVTESRRCFTEAGFETDGPAEVMNSATEATFNVVSSYRIGKLSEDEARRMLAEQASEQQRLIDAIGLCESPRVNIERKVFVEYLNEAGQANSLQLQDWVETAKGAASRFRSQLDQLNGA
jgi:hypothetical protein